MGELRHQEWTAEEIKIVTDMRNDGVSASIIANTIGRSRNAVIGKINRLGMSVKRSVSRTPFVPRVRVRKQPTSGRTGGLNSSKAAIAAARLRVPPPPPVPGGVALVDLEQHHCRAIIGNGDDGFARYCGAQKEGTVVGRNGGTFVSSYCVTHGDEYFSQRAVIRP